MKIERALLVALMMSLAVGFGVFACGDDDDSSNDDAGTDADTDTDTDTDTDADYEFTIEVTVPEDFDATPERIRAVFLPSVDNYMPVGLGSEYNDITIDPETSYQLVTYARDFPGDSDPLADGEYYLAVILYVEGGGPSMPLEGTDWAGVCPTAITIPDDDGADLGSVELGVYGGVDPDGGVPDGGK